MKLDKPQTFPRMAVAVGWAGAGVDPIYAGRALLRLCLRREDEIDKTFVIRDRAGQPDKVTLGAIMRYLPELKPSRTDTLAIDLRQVAEGLERRQRTFTQEEIAKVVTPLEERFAELERKFATLNLATVRRPRRRRRGKRRPNSEPRRTTPNQFEP